MENEKNMKLSDLLQIIKERELNGNLLTIHDSRIYPLPNQMRPPRTITLNRVDDVYFEILYHDDRGYISAKREHLTESEACQRILAYLEYMESFSILGGN